MALIRKRDKDHNEKKPAVGTEAGLKKKEVSKKVAPRGEKKPPAVKKAAISQINRLDRAKKYFRGVYGELKKVHWPTRREVLTYTLVVVVAVIIVSILIWIFDSLLSQVLKLIFR
jgi:preprotein translocase subunit SecE